MLPGNGENLMPLLTVSDIKQYVYCPRIVFYRYVMPVPAVKTYAMHAGDEAHTRITALERRRTARKYDLAQGKKTAMQYFSSERLSLSGVLDLLIESGRELYPVEYKHSVGTPSLHHRYQITAYAMLVEDAYRRTVRQGYVYMLRPDEVFPIEITEAKKLKVKNIVKNIVRVIRSQAMPDPTPHRERCHGCEFRLYCGDTV